MQLKSHNVPAISVILPTKNRLGFLCRALDSLQAQVFSNFEVVLINDGGQDVSDIVKFYSSRLVINYISQPASKGAAAARNLGLAFARGEYIAYLDDDDIFLSNHLDALYQLALCHTESFFFSDAAYVTYIRENGRLTEKGAYVKYKDVAYSRSQLLKSNFIPTPTWFHRRELINQIGYFDTSLEILEDWDFLIRASDVTNFVKLPLTTIEVRSEIGATDHLMQAHRSRLIEYHQIIYEKHASDDESILKGRNELLSELNQLFYGETKEENSEVVDREYRDMLAYKVWIDVRAENSVISPYRHSQKTCQQLADPNFLFTTFVIEDNAAQVEQTVRSLLAQIHTNWSLQVLSFESAEDYGFAWDDARIAWVQLGDEDDSIEYINQAFTVSDAGWLGVLNAGDRLHHTALSKLAEYAIEKTVKWLTFDEDLLDGEGNRTKPIFKPRFNPDLQRSGDYLDGAFLVSQQAFQTVNGFDSTFDGIELYELSLRLLEQVPVQEVLHVHEVLLHRAQEGRLIYLSDEESSLLRVTALTAHHQRLGWPAVVKPGSKPKYLHTAFVSAKKPSVSIILRHESSVEALFELIKFFEVRDEYAACHINVVTTQADLSDYPQAKACQCLRLSFYVLNGTETWTQACNTIAAASNADHLLLLSSQVVSYQSDWLCQLVATLDGMGAGVVSPRVTEAKTGALRNTGIELGCRHLFAGPLYAGQSQQGSFLFDSHELTHNVTAVAADCLLLTRMDFQAVGGLNVALTNADFAATDLCLRITTLRNKRVVWTPIVTVQSNVCDLVNPGHPLVPTARIELSAAHEVEQALLLDIWQGAVAQGGLRNRNLSLNSGRPEMSKDVMLTTKWKDRAIAGPVILAAPVDHTGSGEYRIRAPMRGLLSNGWVQGGVSERIYGPTEIVELSPDVIVLQRQFEDNQMEAIKRYRKYSKAFMVCELDDVVSQGWRTATAGVEKEIELLQARLKESLEVADRLLVSTPTIAELYGDMAKDVKIVPNFIPGDRWLMLKPTKRQTPKPRVGWAGGSSHLRDLRLLGDTIRILADEVDWVLFGDCPDELRPYVNEYYPSLPMPGYPAGLANIGLDLALAPLVDDLFNRGRSALRLLEYGVLGYPVIASDLPSYRNAGLPAKIVPNTTEAWVSTIRDSIRDRDQLSAWGEEMREAVIEKYLLETHLDEWLGGWLPS